MPALMPPPLPVSGNSFRSLSNDVPANKLYRYGVTGFHLLAFALYATGFALLVYDFSVQTGGVSKHHKHGLDTGSLPSSTELPLMMTSPAIAYDDVGSAVTLTVRGFLLFIMATVSVVAIRLCQEKLEFAFQCWALHFLVGTAGFVLDSYIMGSEEQYGSNERAPTIEAILGSTCCIIAGVIFIMLSFVFCRSSSNNVPSNPDDQEALMGGDPSRPANYGSLQGRDQAEEGQGQDERGAGVPVPDRTPPGSPQRQEHQPAVPQGPPGEQQAQQQEQPGEEQPQAERPEERQPEAEQQQPLETDGVREREGGGGNVEAPREEADPEPEPGNGGGDVGGNKDGDDKGPPPGQPAEPQINTGGPPS